MKIKGKQFSVLEANHKNIRQCFVIMPFSTIDGICSAEDWDKIFNDLIKTSVERCGLNYKCTRAESIPGNILRDIVNKLNDADVVIADLSGGNSNVFYELGVRHALGGRSILITQDLKYVPFNLQNYACCYYDWRTPKGRRDFELEIKKLLQNIDDFPHKSDNPCDDVLQRRLNWRLFPKEIQKEHARQWLDKCVSAFEKIKREEIPLDFYNHPEYLNYIFTLIESNTESELIKVFSQSRTYTASGFEILNKRLKRIHDLHRKAVKDKKITIEYTIFFDNPDVLKLEGAQEFLNDLRTYACRIYLLYAENAFELPEEYIEKNIAILSSHKVAFTHHWNKNILLESKTLWVSKQRYEELNSIYNTIKNKGKIYYEKQS